MGERGCRPQKALSLLSSSLDKQRNQTIDRPKEREREGGGGNLEVETEVREGGGERERACICIDNHSYGYHSGVSTSSSYRFIPNNLKN